MAAGTNYSARGNNTSPTSSTLYARIEDVDCSNLTNFPYAPCDGQFLIAPGKSALANTADTTFLGTTKQIDDGLQSGTSALAMVYQSGFKTDADALGATRVPVVRGSVRFKTKLFNKPNDAVEPSHADNGYFPGALLTVQTASDAVYSSSARLVLASANIVASSTPEAKAAIVVGYVTRVVNDSTVLTEGEIEVQLYDKPVILPVGA
jgi:hypothetical protein